jgi:hypothetical protein
MKGVVNNPDPSPTSCRCTSGQPCCHDAGTCVLTTLALNHSTPTPHPPPRPVSLLLVRRCTRVGGLAVAAATVAEADGSCPVLARWKKDAPGNRLPPPPAAAGPGAATPSAKPPVGNAPLPPLLLLPSPLPAPAVVLPRCNCCACFCWLARNACASGPGRLVLLLLWVWPGVFRAKGATPSGWPEATVGRLQRMSEAVCWWCT